jgi:elongation factor 3
MQSVTKAFKAATTGKTKDDRLAGAVEFGAAVKAAGLAKAFTELKLNEELNKSLTAEGKKGASLREGSVYAIDELCKVEPKAGLFLIPNIHNLLEVLGDKQKPVKEAAKPALEGLFGGLDAYLVDTLFGELIKTCHAPAANNTRFKQIQALCKQGRKQVQQRLNESIPEVIPFMADLKPTVQKSSLKTLTALCKTCDNPDMKPFLEPLVTCMKDLTEVPETVFKMASTTFVAEVDSSALAILAPVLAKGLNVTSETHVKRQCARIIENMAKLVDEPRYVSAFIDKILPLLDSAKENVSDPECREVCAKAAARLDSKFKAATPLVFDVKAATAAANAALKKVAAGEADKAENQLMFKYAIEVMVMLNEIAEYTPGTWIAALTPYYTFAGLTEANIKAIVAEVLPGAAESRVEKAEEEVDDGAEVLCDLPFGLAYGNKVLLRKTKLKLLRGKKYGLLGQNDSGKTSLLTALADYKIEGFPTADICRTVFVATDIKTELADLTVLDYMFNDPLLQDCGVSREDMEKTLNSVGFMPGAPANTTQKVGTLSGGWRMKLALSRAMLLKADILLLDEPTNHLDAYNVKWVETYLLSLKNVTCIMVSHDSGLLTRVCDNIIEIDEMKLKYYNGNLDAFVKANPHAKAYFELAKEGKIDFNFPQPGALPGITSKGKAILRMTNISFTYPGVEKPQLKNVTVQVSLSSRVACVGENGAGKSTMIRLLTGELEPDEGSGDVWKHPNCRVGYIAQHAFHHIEKHLDETANEYIRWRYANGGDREEEVKVSQIATEEEIAMMEKPFEIPFPQEDGTKIKRKFAVERFTERRRNNKKDNTVEYECVLRNLPGNHWVERELLCKNGFEKVLKALDDRIALRATTFARPLTKENVQKHLADVGLAAEFSTHMRIGALSGGQKVKVVLASALWNQPHVLILDEPTNYLDRESLGALARAIRKFEGGVVMITHNSQFCDNLCPVVWHLQNNTLDIKGDAEWMAEAAREKIVVKEIQAEDMVDKFGNTVDIKKGKVKSKKEIKAKKARRLKRFKETGDDYDSSDEE